MTRSLGKLSLLLAAGLILSSVRAGDDSRKDRPEVDSFFTKLDANQDGKLSQDEFLQIAERFKDRTKAREKLTGVYQKIDPEHQGISRGQFKTYLETHRKKTASAGPTQPNAAP